VGKLYQNIDFQPDCGLYLANKIALTKGSLQTANKCIALCYKLLYRNDCYKLGLMMIFHLNQFRVL